MVSISILDKEHIVQLKKLNKLFNEYRRYFITGFVCTLIALIFVFPMPWISMTVVDNALKLNNPGLFITLLLVWVGAITFKLIFEFLQGFYTFKYQLYSGQKLRVTALYNLLCVPIDYFKDKQTGYLISRIFQDVEEVVSVMGGRFIEALKNSISLVVGTVLLFIINWKLTILAIGIVPAFLLNQFLFNKKIRVANLAKKEEWAKVAGFIQEVLGGLFSVKAYNREKFEIDQFDIKSEKAIKLSIKNWLVVAFSGTLLGFIQNLAPILIFSIAGYYIMQNEMTVGELIGFVGYLSLLFGPASGVVNYFIGLQSGIVSLERIYEILNHKKEMNITQLSESEKVDQNIQGKIVFKEVNFSYGSGNGVFKIEDFNLEIEPGETVGLIGKTGSGKTTLTNLMLGFYSPAKGAIYIDNKPSTEYTIAQLRNFIFIVPQDVYIFTGTIADNIRYGKLNATMDEIENAARASFAHNFIENLANGYDTLVGERGFQLSGGQKQMISLARGFLKNPKILILDEATSAVDSESEEKIKIALNRLCKSKTTIIISHRLSTILHVDRLVLIENGKILESGKHSDLYNTSNVYRNLFHDQLDFS